VSSSPNAPQAESGSRREAIIDIAAKSFAKQGFHGVSMRDIAKTNGSSVATLYNHFAGKDALMLAIGERFYSIFIRELENASEAPADGLTKILNMVKITYDTASRFRSEYLTLSHDTRHVALTEALAPLVAWRNQCVRLWRQVLDEGMQDGSVQTRVDPAAITWVVLYAITGILEDTRTEELAASVIGDPIISLSGLLSEGLRPRT